MKESKDYKHYIIYSLLVIAIVWAVCREKNGRYALAIKERSIIVILDTKTSQLWERSGRKILYYGTVQNPKVEFTALEDDKTE